MPLPAAMKVTILTIVESPYAASLTHSVEDHLTYARACMRDSLERGEAPLASHLLYTQPGVLDDSIPSERLWGIMAGLAWRTVAHKHAFYVDLGISSGMQFSMDRADEKRALLGPGYEYEIRKIGAPWS